MKIILFIITIFFANTFAVYAADVSVLAPKIVKNNQTFIVSVDLNTDHVLVNSFDITISYPSDILSFKGYKEDVSIKKLWIVPPTNSSGSIHFSGIIPGGVDGVYDPDRIGLQAIPVIELIFSSIALGNGEFTLIHSDILQNDGLGTPLIHENKNSSIVVSNVATSTYNELVLDKSIQDVEPPAPFTIQFIEAGLFSKTPSMIFFSTTDNDLGVEKYQLHTGNIWKDVKSPLPVKKSIFSRYLSIRALDFNGNIREAQVEIPGILPQMYLTLFIVVFICSFMLFMLKRKR